MSKLTLASLEGCLIDLDKSLDETIEVLEKLMADKSYENIKEALNDTKKELSEIKRKVSSQLKNVQVYLAI